MRTLLAATALMLLAGFAHAAETTRYIALVNGGKDKAGHMWVTRDGGKSNVEFIFKDNGRGPELKEEFTSAADGTFTNYHVNGHVHLRRAGRRNLHPRRLDKATGSRLPIRASRRCKGLALYSPLGGTPEGFSVAFAALAQQPDGKVPMIPSGTLSWRKLLEPPICRSGGEKAPGAIGGAHRHRLHADTCGRPRTTTPRLFAFIFRASFS